MMKGSFEMVIYQQLLWELKPKTIFEIGGYTGACALWMGHTMRAYKLPLHVYSVDKNLSLVAEMAINGQNFTIIEGNVLWPWVISVACRVNVLVLWNIFTNI